MDIYAPPATWGTWYDLFEEFGYHGQVTFEELEKSGATTVFYEVMVRPSEEGSAQVVQSAFPGVAFHTYQGASLRAYAQPTGTAVHLGVSW